MKTILLVIFIIISLQRISHSGSFKNNPIDSFYIKIEQQQKIVDALRNGDIHKFSKYINSKYKIDINKRLLGGSTLLVEAISFGQTEITRFLLKSGVDPNLRTAPFNDSNDNPIPDDSPLEAAFVYKSDFATAKLLLDYGAKINDTDVSDGTVLHEIISGKIDKQFSGFYGENEYPKQQKITEEIILEKAEWLIKNGADVNAKNFFGDTPLFKSASRGYNKITSLLLESGARVDIAANDGKTLLHYVEDAELIKKLISLGADVNAAASNGLTPLHLAIFSGNYEKAKLLVENRADVNAEDYESRLTPLGWLVIEMFDSKIAKLLISHGAIIPEELVKQYGMGDEIAKIKKELGR